MYRFLLKPRWILSHLLVLGLVILTINLGFWQLSRLDEKRDFNRLVSERTEAEPVPVEEALAADDSVRDAEEVLYRQVTATGRYLPDEEVLVRNRTFQGKSGAWLLTPMELDDGTAVVINRGWVPVQAGITLQPDWGPPTGTVTVEGLIFPTQARGRFGSTDPSGEQLDTLARADIDRLQEQVDQDLFPAYIQLETQQPDQPGDFPAPLEELELDEGPHLNYAGQWFIFSIIAIVGYPLILRRSAHSRAATRDEEP